MERLNILIIGMGGVGTIVAYGIHYNKSASLSVVSRSHSNTSNTAWQINSCDYGQISDWKPEFIYPSIEEAARARHYDFIVVTTKNIPDYEPLEETVESVITRKKTVIVLIQNGFDLGLPFIEKYPDNICLSGVSYIGSSCSNKIVNHTLKDKCIISYFENPNLSIEEQESKAKQFIQLYSNNRNEIIFSSDVKLARYKKLVYNATKNTVAALTGLDTGRLELFGALESVSLPAMKEVVEIAKADGIILPSDIINTACTSDNKIWYKPSMLIDIEKEQPVEVEVILGNLLKIAKSLNVQTPVLNVLYGLLKAMQNKIKETKGLISLPEKRPESSKYYI